MKIILILFLLLTAFQKANAQTDREIAVILRERVEVGKFNQSIVVAIVDEKGTRFIRSHLKNSLINFADGTTRRIN